MCKAAVRQKNMWHGLYIIQCVSIHELEISHANVIMGKDSNVSAFHCGQIIGARKADCSIFATAELLRFPHQTVAKYIRTISKTFILHKKCDCKHAIDCQHEGRQDSLA